MVDVAQLDSDLEDVADAIRAKSGGSSQLAFPAGFISEIGSIQTGGGGGGSLPSVISKIDGGSFTLASDTLTGSYSISHTLGVAPSGIAIWSDDIVAESYSVRTTWQILAASTKYVVYQINTNATDRFAGGNIGGSDFGTTAFKVTISSNYYKAGATYQWLAWA